MKIITLHRRVDPDALRAHILQLEQEAGLHIVVKEAQLSYLKPVTTTLEARCTPPTAEELRKFQDMLARRGKGRIELKAETLQDGAVAASYVGSFAVYRA